MDGKQDISNHKMLYTADMTNECVTLSVPETKITEFANSADLGEVAHNEPPHLDPLCVLSSL